MAAPSYATDLNDIFTNGGPTWTLVGGGRQTNTETDDFIMGTSCWSHDPFSSGIEGGVMNSSETIAADDAIYYWIKCDVVATLATHANGGMRALVGSGTGALKVYYIRGSDDYAYGGWICIPVDPTKTQSTSIGSPTSTTSYFGAQWNVPGSGAAKGYPMKVDAMRHGRQIEVTAGDSGTPATWDSVSAYDSATARQWGICQPTNTGAALQGLIYWGTATTSVYSRDSNRSIVINDTEWTISAFTQLIFAHASNDVVWDNVGLIALGTNNRGIIDITANGTVTWTNSIFSDIDVTNLGGTGSTFDGCKWIGCNEIDANGGSLVGAQVLLPTVAADSYSVLWNVAADPDGSLDNMTFSKGTASHHAIEFGTTMTDNNITLRGIDFSGFSGTSTAAALNFLRTDAVVTTINLVGCTGTITSQVTGSHTVAYVIDPVTTLVHVENSAGTDLQNARVWLKASDGTGYLPYQESVTITQTGGVATVSHTAHGLVTGDWVEIKGVTNGDNYNGAQQITYVSDNSYTYTCLSGLPATATGTITSTGAIFNDLTDSSGDVSDSRSLSGAQPVTGWVRLSTTPGSLYVTQPIGGSISATTGLTINVTMVSDE